MRERVLYLWQRITEKRHRSELSALRRARLLPPLAIFPIGLNVMFWWFALCIPSVVPFALGHNLTGSDGVPAAIGYLMLAVSQLYALIALLAATPWFFRWYFIAAGLMIGRTAMADRKEAELIAALAATNASGVD